MFQNLGYKSFDIITVIQPTPSLNRFTGDESDLPKTTSIQKQITYGEYISKYVTKVDVKEVYNAFLLPYDKERDKFRSEDNLQYIGFAKSKWKDNKLGYELVSVKVARMPWD